MVDCAAMSKAPVNPSTRLVSFSCPHCGAHSHQTWHDVYADRLEGGKTPSRPAPDTLEKMTRDVPPEVLARIRAYIARLLRGEVFLEPTEKQLYKPPQLENVWVSLCYSCEQPSVWVHDSVVHPAIAAAGIDPNDDLSDDIKHDFKEANAILNASPRGAAALLRLCIQKLCAQLGEKGKNLNDDIASLVSKGLDEHVRQALDIVRVVGNNAVHPGQIDLGDDRDTALKLFELVNEIAEDRITRPARTRKLYEKVVPESARKAIEKRDGKG